MDPRQRLHQRGRPATGRVHRGRAGGAAAPGGARIDRSPPLGGRGEGQLVTAALVAPQRHRAAWWYRPAELSANILADSPTPSFRHFYRLADVSLEVASNSEAALQSLGELYGDCAASGTLEASLSAVLRVPAGSSIALLSLTG